MDALIQYKVAVIGVIFFALFSIERITRSATPPENRARLLRNGILWFIVLLASPLLVAPITAFGANHLLWERPSWMMTGYAVGVFLIIDLIILDIWTYWLHRAYHRVPFLWRFHEVHHRDEFLDTTTAVRFHLGEVLISSSLRIVIITLLAAPLSTVILFETILLVSALFHHSNIAIPKKLERGLAKVIVTPSIHWVHHHAVRADTDSNYATFLSCWDVVFGSRSLTERQQSMKIGVEGLEDESIFRLIFMPFGKRNR